MATLVTDGCGSVGNGGCGRVFGFGTVHKIVLFRIIIGRFSGDDLLLLLLLFGSEKRMKGRLSSWSFGCFVFKLFCFFCVWVVFLFWYPYCIQSNLPKSNKTDDNYRRIFIG